MGHLAENRYGKSRVRLMKVVRHAAHDKMPAVHEMKEWNVRLLLQGDFGSCFTTGDNSKILPTDTMKNTVYSLARDSKANTSEQFAMELGQYLLDNNAQVSSVSVDIEEKKWEHVLVDGMPHPTTYSLNGTELQTVAVEKNRGGEFQIISGIDGLVVLKTTDSEFTGYIKDKLTTLPETTDRIFATRATIVWGLARQPAEFTALRTTVRDRVLTTFANHHSLSVQHTIHDVGEAVLKAVPDISWIKMTMPNLHCLPVNLAPFGQDNPNMIFVPTDEPSGYIEATIRR